MRFADDPSIDNLAKIDHIVVLMMENRSFDHLLGYLTLEGGRADVDGLTFGLSNSYNGKLYPIYHLPYTAFGDNPDPCHAGDCVFDQLSGSGGGFVRNYAATGANDPGLVMGYYRRDDLPVYDHLAAEFSICDRWFSSVPGATWPNRLYAVAGRSAGSKDNQGTPLYGLRSFVRHLDAAHVPWRWYAFESFLGNLVTTLRLTDRAYRFAGNHSKFDPEFLNHAAAGTLPAVSWIDPNFVDFGGSASANDDHPPADITAGQELALKVYHAISRGPQWEKTLLVIVYDEHGGFYDHVQPAPAQDDDPEFQSYGARVPAILISPWVKRGGVEKLLFDHTSLVKTILLRFCRRPDGSIPDMGARVNAADHLGRVLTEDVPRPAPPVATYQPAIDRIAEWHAQTFKARIHGAGVAALQSTRKLNDFQQGLLAAAKKLEKEGASKRK